jgi:phage terminase Nu1 subunit (DNA packaging protein)
MICNKKQLADVMGVSERTLTEWQELGMPIESVGGRGLENQYETAKVIEWRVQRALAGEQVVTAREERDRLESKLLQMRIAKEADLLVPADEIGPTWESAIVAARTELLALPIRIKTVLDAKYSLDVDKLLIEAEVRLALDKLADHPPAVGPDAEDLEDLDEPDFEEVD